MRFQVEHWFHGAPGAVADLLVDPELYRALQLPDVSLPDVLDGDGDAGEAVLRLRYEFVGDLDPFARRILGGKRLVWLQETRVDPLRAAGTFSFHAEADPRRLHGKATFRLVSTGGLTLRRLEADLTVAVLGVGRMAEARIVPGLLRRLDLEAAAIERRLSEGA